MLPAVLGCGHERLAAVTGAACADEPEQAACALPVWPNAYSGANSAYAQDGTRMKNWWPFRFY